MEHYIKLYDERKGYLKKVGCLIDVDLIDTNTSNGTDGAKYYSVIQNNKTVAIIAGQYNEFCKCFYIGF